MHVDHVAPSDDRQSPPLGARRCRDSLARGVSRAHGHPADLDDCGSTGGEPEPRDGSVISFAFGEETEHVVSELGAGSRTTQAHTTELCSPRFPASGVACCPEERVEEDLYHLPTNWNPAASFCASGRTLTPAVGLSATIFDS
jgi:hypothetical protein